MQSNLSSIKLLVTHKPRLAHLLGLGPVAFARQRRSMGLYVALISTALLIGSLAKAPAVKAFALGVIAPGAGFLHWAGPDSATQGLAVMLAGGGMALFAISLILWFATGNIILPPLLWLTLALLAGDPALFGLDSLGEWRGGILVVPSSILTAFFAVVGLRLRWVHQAEKQAALPVRLYAAAAAVHRPELSPDDLRLMCLILDRALQPVDDFNGFEWRDQFQTAAVRYQINFMSYALSLAQAHYLPAMRGYLATAQQRLLEKQSHPRIWGYWALENAWGNLRAGGDPVPRDNIMYSGFIAAQMAFAKAAGFAGEQRLRLGPNRDYDFDDLTALLAAQYEKAEFGLLACEPNWIYPLCNLITATALRTHDGLCGTDHWQKTAARFRQGLDQEFTGPNGRIVAFRSSITGFAPPSVGGAVMQAFPCFFLNGLFPDIAERQWAMFRDDLAKQDWRRAFWPIDVGNYAFSRASSLSASAAAAVEMGDGQMAEQLLGWLDEECPMTATHRTDASLWAHALELAARCGRENGLRTLITAAQSEQPQGPWLGDAAYPEILVAKAESRAGALFATLYPGDKPGQFPLEVGGLRPERHYRVEGADVDFCKADASGKAQLHVVLSGRTPIHICPLI